MFALEPQRERPVVHEAQHALVTQLGAEARVPLDPAPQEALPLEVLHLVALGRGARADRGCGVGVGWVRGRWGG